MHHHKNMQKITLNYFTLTEKSYNGVLVKCILCLCVWCVWADGYFASK